MTPSTTPSPSPWEFDRYVDGVLMAEGVAIFHANSIEEATRKATRICPKRPRTVLVLTSVAKPAVAPAYGQTRIPTHPFNPDPQYPWFCADCGYPEHERLKHGEQVKP